MTKAESRIARIFRARDWAALRRQATLRNSCLISGRSGRGNARTGPNPKAIESVPWPGLLFP